MFLIKQGRGEIKCFENITGHKRKAYAR